MVGLVKMISSESLSRFGSAGKVVILTGAGVSAESGVPTFRGKDGLWNNYRAEELATPGAFRNDPELVWKWYNWRRGELASKNPNEGHTAIREMELFFDDFLLITQNVDGLHRVAGSERCLELHGNIRQTRCTSCGDVADAPVEEKLKTLPECKKCGALLRPHIIWFGESLDGAVLNEAILSARNCDIFIVAGTSGLVQPAASLALMAKEGGALVIETNIMSTPVSEVADETLIGRSSETLPSLLQAVKNGK
jgi:NAD-dependent deacetylase